MTDYEIKRQARIDRMRELAERNSHQAQMSFDTAHKMADIIPFGQPILVGHHSEGRDRNYRARIQGKFEKGIELQKKAEYYAGRVHAAEHNPAISSDDPTAVDQLQAKIDKAEACQALMVAANKIIRRTAGTRAEKIAELEALGIPKPVERLFEPDFAGRVGFANYALTNNSGNIHRMKERIAHLQKHSTDTTAEIQAGDIRIVDNVEINRVQIFFPGKPNDEIRSNLKSNGFRWSPTEGAWQRQRSQYALDIAKRTALT
jgi:hypothetical protein